MGQNDKERDGEGEQMDGRPVTGRGSDVTDSRSEVGVGSSPPPDGEDGEKEDGHIVHSVGMLLNQRYQVVGLLGEGAFGKVLECVDRMTEEHVAVKVVKNTECFQEAGRSEVAVLQEINQLDDEHVFGCVRMIDSFDHQGHVCIVLELLGMNTFTFIQQNQQQPFTIQHIQHMAFTLVRAVAFLHRHQLTHTDLKPENILFVNNTRKLNCVDVKVVDFGTATFDHQHHPSVVSTRHYRAPEIILGLGWKQSCDVWSLGCVFMEFYLGRTLFPTHDTREHLAMMEKVLGPIPEHLLKQTKKQHYVSEGRLLWDDRCCSDDVIKHCQPLKLMTRRTEEERHLLDLIGLMLEYDVSRRLSLDEALWHPFFRTLHPHISPRRTAPL